MKTLKFVFLVFLAVLQAAPSFAADAESDATLRWLKNGNRRFQRGQHLKPRQDMDTVYSLRNGQAPKAAILTCCDSRVDAGTLFDAGLGDFFEVEVAGNFLTPEGRASLKYAVEHLGVRTLIVMGHKSCGAVAAAVKKNADPDYAPLINQLLPAVLLATDRGGPPEEFADRAALANVELTMAKLLETDHYLGKMAASGQLKVYGAFYNLIGEVIFFKSPGVMAYLLSKQCPLGKLIPRAKK